ncbi:unannotated protein [freshwater metagenome]|uniref:Unannotated protein n=1 Tax=freshwater metagenome TaxID=449393 RepID=A0A6J7C393_9ZZZZ
MLLERETQFEQKPALKDARRHGRITDRAEQDCIRGCKFCHDRVREHFTRGVVARGPEVVVDTVEGDPVASGHGIEDLEPLGDHLHTDSITGDNGKAIML